MRGRAVANTREGNSSISSSLINRVNKKNKFAKNVNIFKHYIQSFRKPQYMSYKLGTQVMSSN